MSRAEKAFRAAEYLLEGGFLTDAVSKAYYAAFYAATSLLSTRGLSPRSHQSAMRLFGLEFVKPGLMPGSHGRLLSVMFKERQDVDYDEAPVVTVQDARAAVDQARDLVSDASRLLDEILAAKDERADG